MNDPWDVKSVRQSSQYMSCMRINGVPLLPPVLSKECRKEMQYYKLLAKEVEKRITQLKPYVVESDTESSEDKTDAPELPESEQSYELAPEDIQANFNINIEKVTAVSENCEKESPKSPDNDETFNTKISNYNVDSDSSSKNTSKFVIDLSLSINETGRSILDNIKSPVYSSPPPPIELPERDCECPPKGDQQKHDNKINTKDKSDIIEDKLSFSFSINRENLSDPLPSLSLHQDGPSSLSSKSFTGSLGNIHTESVKESKTIPLTRQRSYTVLTPSPLLLAHLEVQSLNTGVAMTSISMSESLSNLSSPNKKRRSWDLETAKVKWSSMALELKQKNIANNAKPNGVTNEPTAKSAVKKMPQPTPPRSRSVVQEKPKRFNASPKIVAKSEPLQRSKKTLSPVRNAATNKNTTKTPTPSKPTNQKDEPVATKPQLISESEDPATRVRELYDKIQKQQLVQMANLVEKQKREQLLLQQAFEEQNNLLFTQLKTICPKSPNEVKEAWKDSKEAADRGPVSLSQLINHKTAEHSVLDSPVSSTLTDTHNYINHCDSVLKKSRDISGGIKKQQIKPAHAAHVSQATEKSQSPKSHSEGSRTRTHSPSQRSSTSRKLTYENSMSSDRDCDPILTDRTNDTMADLNVTLPSDHSDDCQPYNHNNTLTNNLYHNDVVACQNSVPIRVPSGRSHDRAVRSVEETKQNYINNMCSRTTRPNVFRPPTAQERSAATTIVAFAKGYLVRRLMRTERVQTTVQTIKDALLCALQLHQDREGIRGADVDLHRRLIQQITAACYALHDTFVSSTPAERCAMIAADRGRRRSLAARPPVLPQRHYKPTDIMSQSHSGAFPPRVKRPPASLMTQSNYETFSGEKCGVRSRYMPSPRRRPWR